MLTLGGRDYSVTGTIDRLAVSADAVRIIDFKTNRPPPENLDAVPPAFSPSSTTVYLTITGQLLQGASARFERFASPVLEEIRS